MLGRNKVQAAQPHKSGDRCDSEQVCALSVEIGLGAIWAPLDGYVFNNVVN